MRKSKYRRDKEFELACRRVNLQKPVSRPCSITMRQAVRAVKAYLAQRVLK